MPRTARPVLDRIVEKVEIGVYAHGLSLGYEFAEADLKDGAACGSKADELRAEAREARSDESRSWAVFKLGIVRGYRMSVRTLRNGKWGT